MKIFLDDFTVYSDMESHLQKLKLCFQKCKEYGINLNIDKCAFMVFSRAILGFIVSKEGKLRNPKKIQTTCHHLKILGKFKHLMGWYNSTDVLSKTLLLLSHL
jgi:hypothetical protein